MLPFTFLVRKLKTESGLSGNLTHFFTVLQKPILVATEDGEMLRNISTKASTDKMTFKILNQQYGNSTNESTVWDIGRVFGDINHTFGSVHLSSVQIISFHIPSGSAEWFYPC